MIKKNEEWNFTFIPPYPSTWLVWASCMFFTSSQLSPSRTWNTFLIFCFFFFSDPLPLTLALHVPHPIDGPLSSKNIIFSTCFSKTRFSYQLLDLLELLWVCVDGHELVVVLDLGGVGMGWRSVWHPLQVRQSSEASSFGWWTVEPPTFSFCGQL